MSYLLLKFPFGAVFLDGGLAVSFKGFVELLSNVPLHPASSTVITDTAGMSSWSAHHKQGHKVHKTHCSSSAQIYYGLLRAWIEFKVAWISSWNINLHIMLLLMYIFGSSIRQWYTSSSKWGQYVNMGFQKTLKIALAFLKNIYVFFYWLN